MPQVNEISWFFSLLTFFFLFFLCLISTSYLWISGYFLNKINHVPHLQFNLLI